MHVSGFSCALTLTRHRDQSTDRVREALGTPISHASWIIDLFLGDQFQITQQALEQSAERPSSAYCNVQNSLSSLMSQSSCLSVSNLHACNHACARSIEYRPVRARQRWQNKATRMSYATARVDCGSVAPHVAPHEEGIARGTQSIAVSELRDGTPTCLAHSMIISLRVPS